jgi:hypothetical protein
MRLINCQLRNDAAKSAKAVLSTGNLRHFPAEKFIIAPVEFLKQL